MEMHRRSCGAIHDLRKGKLKNFRKLKKFKKTVDVYRFYVIILNVYGFYIHRITQSVMLLEGLKGGQVQNV